MSSLTLKVIDQPQTTEFTFLGAPSPAPLGKYSFLSQIRVEPSCAPANRTGGPGPRCGGQCILRIEQVVFFLLMQPWSRKTELLLCNGSSNKSLKTVLNNLAWDLPTLPLCRLQKERPPPPFESRSPLSFLPSSPLHLPEAEQAGES